MIRQLTMLTAGVTVGLALSAAPVHAQSEAGQPQTSGVVFGGSVEAKLQRDRVVPPDESQGKAFSDTSMEAKVGLFAKISPSWSLRSVLKLERVKDHDENASFRDEGAWVDQLYFSYDASVGSAYVGKIHPRFALGWDVAPGLYGADFAEGYELTEKIGIGLAYRLPTSYGDHKLTAEAFYADTTALSKSVGAQPKADERLVTRTSGVRKSDGGVSNTEDLSSFAVTLVGRAMPVAPKLEYALGFAKLAKGEGTQTEESRSAATLRLAEGGVGFGVSTTPLLEVVEVRNAEGAQDVKISHQLAGLDAGFRDWTFSVVIHSRTTRTPAGVVKDRLDTVSVGYDLSTWMLEGSAAKLGWKRAEENHVAVTTTGLALTYELKF